MLIAKISGVRLGQTGAFLEQGLLLNRAILHENFKGEYTLELGLKHDEVRLESYRPEWKEEFIKVKKN